MKSAHYEGRLLNVACHGKWYLTYFNGSRFKTISIGRLTDKEGNQLSVGDKIKVTVDPSFTLEKLKDESLSHTLKIIVLEQLATHYKDNETILRMIKLHLSKLY